MNTLTCTFIVSIKRVTAGCLRHIKIVLAACLFLLANLSQAAPTSGVTYTGRILDSNDQPVTASQVYFTITISDPDQKCWLYTEQRLIDMSASAGNFAFEVGSSDPSTLFGTPSLNNPLGGGPATFSDVFDNSKSFTGLTPNSYTCPGNAYNPSSSTDKNEGRVMAIFFRIGATGTDQALPALRITPVPLAMQAMNSMKVNGYDKNHLLRIDPSIASPVNSDLNGTQLAEFFRLVNNPSTAYLTSSATLGGDASGTIGAVSVDKIKGQAIAGTAPASGDVLKWNGSAWAPGAAAVGGITSINGQSGVTQSFASGTTALSINSATNTHTLSISNATSSADGLLTSTDWTTFNSKQSNSLGAGQVWVGNAGNGAQARTLGGDIASISDTGIVALKSVGTAGTYYKVVTDAQGRVVSGDASMTATDLPTLADGKVWIGNGSNAATAYAMSGDATMSNIGVLTLKNTGTVGTYTKVITDAQGRVTGSASLNSGDITGALGYTPVNKAGDTMSGSLMMGANTYIGLGAGSTDGTVAGQMWLDGTTIKYFDGSVVKALGVAGAGITSINGSSAVSQSFAAPTTAGATAPAWSTNTGTGVHTLDIPMAATGGVTAGLISNAEYASLNGKLTSPLTTKGDLLTRDGSTHIRLPVGSNNEVLTADSSTASGLKWAPIPAAGITDLTGDVTATGPGSAAASIGTGKVTSTHILDGTVVGADLNFTGVNVATSGIVIKDNTGKFFNFACATAGDVATWTVTGWTCQAPATAVVSNKAALADGKMWVGNGSNVAAEVNISGDATMDNAGVVTLKNTGTVGTYTKVITDAQGRVTGSAALTAGDITGALTYTPVNKAGDTMTGSLMMGAGTYIGLGAGSTAGTVAGQMWLDGAVIKYYDGTGVKALGVAGAGITSMNGSSAVSQSFAAPTTAGASAPAWSTNTGTGVHTLDIPMAATGGVTAGLISNADYSSMMAKQSNALASTKVWIGNAGGGAEAQTLSGDIATVSNTGVVALKTIGAVSTYYKVITDAQGRVTSGSTSLATTDMPALADGKVWIGNASNAATAVAMTGDATMDNAGVVTLKNTGTVGTYTKVITDAQGRVTGSAALTAGDITGALTYTPVNKAGDTMGGALNMGGFDITNTGSITMANNKYFTLSSNTTPGNTTGQMWLDGATIKYYDGSGVKALGVAGAGITSINGSSAVSQSFAAPTTAGASAPAWSTNTGTGVHTLDIPMAATSGVTAGLISNTEYTTLNGKLTSPLTTKGDLLTRDGSTHIRLPVGSNNEVLTADSSTASGLKWAPIPAAGITDLTGDVTATGPGSAAATIGTGKVTSTHILDGTIVGADLNFTGVNVATSGIVIKDNTGKFFNFACATAGDVATWTVTGWTCQTPATAVVSNKAALASGKVWVGNGSNVAAEVALSGDATMDNTGLVTLKSVGAVGTYTKVITDAQGRVTGSAALTAGDITGALTYTPVNKAGDTMTGNLMIGAGKYIGLGAGSTAGTVAGQMWLDGTTIKYFDGSTTQALGVAGAGITSINGSTVSSQTFPAPGTSGNAPAWAFNAGAGSHTLNIPMASASGSVTAGLISNADYVAFNGKQSTALTAGQIWVGNSGNIAQARALSGDINSITDTGLVTATKTTSGLANTLVSTDGTGVVNSFGVGLKGSVGGTVTLSSITGTTANYNLKFPATAPSNNQILQSDNTGALSWINTNSITDATKLPLAGGTMTGAIITSAGTAAAPSVGVGQTTSGIYSGGTNILAFSTAGNERMRVSATGKVGINQNNPTYDLDITGTMHILGDFAAENNIADDTAANFNLWKSRAYAKTLANDSIGNLSMYGHDGTSLRRGAYIAGLQQADSTANSVPTNLTFGTADVGNTNAIERMRIASNGSVGIGGSPNASAILDLTSTTKGLLLPRMTTANRDAIASPQNGLQVYNTSTGKVNFYNGSWQEMAATGSITINNSAALTNGAIWIGNGSNVAVERTLSGDMTMTNAGVVTLKSVGAAGTYTKVVTDAQGRVISSGSLTATDLPALADTKIWIGNSSGGAVAYAMSGDATMSNIGSLTLNTVGVAKGGTGATTLTSGALLVGNGTGTVNTLAGGTAGNVIYATSGTAWASASPDTAGLVDKSSNQTVAGNKTLSGATTIQNGTLVNTSGTATTTVVDAGAGTIKTNGQIYAGYLDNASGVTTIDFNYGNVQTSSADCGSTINLTNMQSGGSYTLVIKGAGTTKCSFQDGGVAIPDNRFAPTNTTRTALSATVYTMIKVGSVVYVSWITGFSP